MNIQKKKSCWFDVARFNKNILNQFIFTTDIINESMLPHRSIVYWKYTFDSPKMCVSFS